MAEVSLDTRPSDSSMAQQLASTVAARAQCSSFESLDPPSGEWIFGCAIDEHPFTIYTVPNAEKKKAAVDALKPNAVVTGPYYIVVEAAMIGLTSDPTLLKRFPGVLTSASNS